MCADFIYYFVHTPFPSLSVVELTWASQAGDPLAKVAEGEGATKITYKTTAKEQPYAQCVSNMHTRTHTSHHTHAKTHMYPCTGQACAPHQRSYSPSSTPMCTASPLSRAAWMQAGSQPVMSRR